jgi:hypothetical protein
LYDADDKEPELQTTLDAQQLDDLMQAAVRHSNQHIVDEELRRRPSHDRPEAKGPLMPKWNTFAVLRSTSPKRDALSNGRRAS